MKYFNFLLLFSLIFSIGFLFFDRNLLNIIFSLLFCIAFFSVFSKNFREQKIKLKMVFLFVNFIGLCSVIIIHFMNIKSIEINQIRNQIPIFLSLICLFINCFLIFVIEFKLKFSSRYKQCSSLDEVNPATGLPMQNGIDSGGNVFGQRMHRKD